jgi:hypothetical protein
MADTLTVHDPRGFPPHVEGKPLAPRLPSLDGKVVYLVDCLFDNSEAFVLQVQRWFSENLPAVDTRVVQPTESWAEDPELCAKIQRDGDAAILGVGL